MARVDLLIIGGAVAALGVLAYHLYRFNMPVYMPVMEETWEIEIDPRLEDILLAVERGINASPAP